MLAGACLAAQIYLFILALTNTTAANTFVLMSLSPLFAALAGLLFLRERVAWHTWMAIALALGGVAIMFGSGLDTGHLLGNLFALCIPMLYASQIICVRKVRGSVDGQAPDLLPTVLLAGVMAATPALLLGWPLEAAARDVSLLALMGCVQLGVGCWLATLAVQHLRAAEIGLLALVETILAPLWVWLGGGEAPGNAALAGGALIVGALVVNGWLGLRHEKWRKGNQDKTALGKS